MNAHLGNDFGDAVKLQTLPVRPHIDHTTIKRLAVKGGKAAAEAYAADAADAANAGLRARAEKGFAYAAGKIQALTAEIEMHQARIIQEGGVRMRRLNYAEANVKLTRLEWLQGTFYILMTLVALMTASTVLALIIMEGADVPRLAMSFRNSLGYAFPIIMIASGFAIWATNKDDDPVIEARIGTLLKYAFTAFCLWVVATGVVFVGQGNAFGAPVDITTLALLDDDLLADDPTVAGADWINSAYAITGALFPKTTTGTFLLILHILSDVLISGALTAKVIFMGRKTRAMETFLPDAAVEATKAVSTLEAARQVHEAEEADFTELLAQIDATKQAHVSEVSLLADSVMTDLEAKRAAAIAAVNAEYAK